MNLSKNKIKYVNSLKEKKYRDEHQCFVAEGNKLVLDLLQNIPCQLLLATSDFLANHTLVSIEEIVEVTQSELNKVSFVKTPQQVLAVFYQPHYVIDSDLDNKLSLVLDGIQDPGNLGTIVRLSDWYGIENIFCSRDTCDIYNPKSVQATMGALARIKLHYLDLVPFLEKHSTIPVYGTFLDGENMYSKTLSKNGFIMMGNEGNGIRSTVSKCVTDRIYIPNFPTERETSESLNVSIATAIICAEFRRRIT